MAGYDDYQTEEEYIAAAKKRWEREMDTKELVARLRRGCNCRLCKMDRCCCAEMEDAADTIERLERERDFEQSSRLTSEAQLGTYISNLEAELTTLRARVAKMEGVLRQVVHACFHYTGEDQDDLVNDAYDNAASLLSQEEQQP